MGWFNEVKNPKLKSVKKVAASNTPEGLWKKCSNCGEILQTKRLVENLHVCPYCQYHFRCSVSDRIGLLLDENTFQEVLVDARSTDPLKFNDKIPYAQRIEEAEKKSGIKESSVVGTGKMNGLEVSICVMDFAYMGGSMGAVTGEKVAKSMEIALAKKIPCVVLSCSGGARMQEGILSLMQMGKTSGLRQKLKENSVPYISILTDPTTGGTAASYAMLGDVNIAEPHALIGFAGPRVIEQSIRQTLPDGFQRSEFLLEHGFIDRIVERKNLKQEISYFVDFFSTR
jgi:acetyl-CoA carboxylase carboxyl transferase subunit beta